jgi:RNA polymerase sigma factor (sigma-70 family)
MWRSLCCYNAAALFCVLFRDKPGLDRPRCRSPPLLLGFETISKIEQEENPMSERKQYFIRVAGQLVPVTEDVYREYYRMGRRERYLEERDAANGTILYSDMDTGETLGEEAIPDTEAKSVEQTVIDGMMSESLRRCLGLLSDDERSLIEALYFQGHSEREWSAISGIPRKTIGDRRNRIIAKLKKLMEN